MNKENIEPEIKTLEDLINEGLVPKVETERLSNTIVLIFPNKSTATKYVKEVFLPNIEARELIMMWSCLTGPISSNGLAKIMGIIPDDEEKWLLLQKDDFEKIIKPAMSD